MALPSDFNNEIDRLTQEYNKYQPTDILQFCANHFLRRLESERADHLASSPRSTTAPVMASTFPGTNPFASSGSDRGMQSVQEEDEDPKSLSAAPPAGSSSTRSPPPAASSGFGAGGFGNWGEQQSGGGASLPQNYNFNRRTSVSAESMNPADTASDNWTPPVHPKTPEQQGRLEKAVAHNFIFSHLDKEQKEQVLGALYEKPIPAKGIKVIEQGDQGDYFYVIEKGTFDIYVNPAGHVEPGPEGMGKKVNSIGPDGSFGELALMYNAPRAATVISVEPSVLWQLDRLTFRRILMDSAFQRRTMYEKFLSEVPLLEPLTDYERSKIADALQREEFPAGHTIIKQGDPGENFFFLESGEADVYIDGQEGSVKKYGKGDYFGELALLNDKPRAASVVSSSPVKVATLGREGFQRLLGPVQERMRENDPSKQGENVDPLSPGA